MNASLPPAQWIPAGTMDCLVAVFVFFALLTPVYLVMRSLVRLTRIRYGFEQPGPDEGPPIRVCDRCGNTVLESDYSHCPYCGELLGPPIPAAGGLPEPAPGDEGEPGAG